MIIHTVGKAGYRWSVVGVVEVEGAGGFRWVVVARSFAVNTFLGCEYLRIKREARRESLVSHQLLLTKARHVGSE